MTTPSHKLTLCIIAAVAAAGFFGLRVFADQKPKKHSFKDELHLVFPADFQKGVIADEGKFTAALNKHAKPDGNHKVHKMKFDGKRISGGLEEDLAQGDPVHVSQVVAFATMQDLRNFAQETSAP